MTRSANFVPYIESDDDWNGHPNCKGTRTWYVVTHDLFDPIDCDSKADAERKLAEYTQRKNQQGEHRGP